MTTLAVPYYGKLYHDSTGFERVYFLVDYDADIDRTGDIRLKVWDESQNPDFCEWLKENEASSIICRDADTLPILEKVTSKGISVLQQGSRCAQSIMSNLYL